MIISHKHKFIFIHCPKVAGSSITAYFNPYLGPNDLQLGSWKDSLQNGGRFNRRIMRELMTLSGLYHIAKKMSGHVKKPRRLHFAKSLNHAHKRIYDNVIGNKPEHATARQVKKFAPVEWDTYFKFCFIRNPYAHAVSLYKWRTRKNSSNVSFTEFLERMYNTDRPDPENVLLRHPINWDMYTLNDQIAVDYIGRMETLLADMEEICHKIGLPFDPSAFPHAKQMNKVNTHYRQWYSTYEKKLVAHIYQKEIQHFGYCF